MVLLSRPAASSHHSVAQPPRDFFFAAMRGDFFTPLFDLPPAAILALSAMTLAFCGVHVAGFLLALLLAFFWDFVVLGGGFPFLLGGDFPFLLGARASTLAPSSLGRLREKLRLSRSHDGPPRAPTPPLGCELGGACGPRLLAGAGDAISRRNVSSPSADMASAAARNRARTSLKRYAAPVMLRPVSCGSSARIIGLLPNAPGPTTKSFPRITPLGRPAATAIRA
mmetsp:Transcript_12074/g.48446  ORF Transcript_12074/g.48446 Transcript_12074/m.48446 type:complete len:225 (-) Transcript_12074:2391-3065(-)